MQRLGSCPGAFVLALTPQAFLIHTTKGGIPLPPRNTIRGDGLQEHQGAPVEGEAEFDSRPGLASKE